MTQPTPAETIETPAGKVGDKVPADSWYALSVLVLIYILNFIDFC